MSEWKSKREYVEQKKEQKEDFKEQEGVQSEVVEDKKNTSKIAGELNSNRGVTTNEAGREIQRAFENADKHISKTMNDEVGVHEEKAEGASRVESEIAEESAKSEEDAVATEQLAGKIKRDQKAINAIRRGASSAARESSKFQEGIRKERKEDRTESERTTERQHREEKSTDVNVSGPS